MTDEDDVEERYQPTKINLVRPPPTQPRLESTYLNDVFLQRREIKALCRGVMPGDRRVFYCMFPPSTRFTSPALMLPQRLVAGHSDQMPCTTGSEEDGMDEGEQSRSSSSFTYVERLSHQCSSRPMGSELETTFVAPSLRAIRPLTLSCRRLTIG